MRSLSTCVTESIRADRLRLRVLVDVNILISFLIRPGNVTSTIYRAVRIASSDRFQAIVPVKLLTELRDAPQKPTLSPFLSDRATEDFIASTLLPSGLVVSTEQLTTLGVLQYLRDPKDRYLLEATIQHDVDILVSGDKDLLALAPYLELPRIMSPAQFVAELGAGG